jgi:hypothetical protein
MPQELLLNFQLRVGLAQQGAVLVAEGTTTGSEQYRG